MLVLKDNNSDKFVSGDKESGIKAMGAALGITDYTIMPVDDFVIPAAVAEVAYIAREALWVESEMFTADKRVNAHTDVHGRPNGTELAWRTYRNELRDYIIGGVIQGARPVEPV